MGSAGSSHQSSTSVNAPEVAGLVHTCPSSPSSTKPLLPPLNVPPRCELNLLSDYFTSTCPSNKQAHTSWHTDELIFSCLFPPGVCQTGATEHSMHLTAAQGRSADGRVHVVTFGLAK